MDTLNSPTPLDTKGNVVGGLRSSLPDAARSTIENFSVFLGKCDWKAVKVNVNLNKLKNAAVVVSESQLTLRMMNIIIILF